MTSFNRKLAGLIGNSGSVKSTGFANLPSGDAAYYTSLDSLPVTGLSKGDTAFVVENSRLYVSNSLGWYNTDFISSAAPYWDSGGEPEATYTISDSATPLTIIADANDSDNPNLVNQSFVSDSAQYLVTITNDSSVWTFTPKSADSIGAEVAAGNLSDSGGDFVYTFKWSDGTSIISKEVTITYSTAPPTGVAWGGDRALAQVGYTTSDYNGNGQDYDAVVKDIEYFDITTQGSCSNFGDQYNFAAYRAQTMSNGTRGIFWGGDRDVWNWNGKRYIQYVTTATTGNASVFGQPLYYHVYQDSFNRNIYNTLINGAGTSDGIYAIQIGGGGGGNQGLQTRMEYVVIDTQADATIFGYYANKTSNNSAWNDATRSVMYHGSNADYYSVWMKYFTTQTTGNATAISNSHPHGTGHSSCSDSTWGVTYGGTNSGQSNNITYNVTQNLSDASSFGSLSTTRSNSGGTYAGFTSNGTYGVIVAGGNKGNPYQNMERITIKTLGNASDFGNFTYEATGCSALSGSAS